MTILLGISLIGVSICLWLIAGLQKRIEKLEGKK